MGWFDSVTGFISDNSDWLKPVVQTGLGALTQSNSDKAQSQYLDYLKSKEDKNYQDYVNSVTAYNAQLGQGGGGGNSGASAAARANDAKRMAASKKAQKVSQNTYKELLKMLAPLRETADRLLPQKTAAYEGGLTSATDLPSFANSPEQKAKLNGSIPAWAVNVPLPDSVRIK